MTVNSQSLRRIPTQPISYMYTNTRTHARTHAPTIILTTIVIYLRVCKEISYNMIELFQIVITKSNVYTRAFLQTHTCRIRVMSFHTGNK